jgi:hypothetical protein
MKLPMVACTSHGLLIPIPIRPAPVEEHSLADTQLAHTSIVLGHGNALAVRDATTIA